MYNFELTSNFYFERKCNAGQTVAHRAGVVSAVLGDQVLKSDAPPVIVDGTQMTLWRFVILRPCDVGDRIPLRKTFQFEEIPSRLQYNPVHRVGFDKFRFTFRFGFVEGARFFLPFRMVFRVRV